MAINYCGIFKGLDIVAYITKRILKRLIRKIVV